MNAIIKTVFDDIVAYFKLNPVKVIAYAVAAKLVLDKASDLIGIFLKAVGVGA